MSAEGETATANEVAYDPEDSVNTSAVSADVSVPDDPLSVASPKPEDSETPNGDMASPGEEQAEQPAEQNGAASVTDIKIETTTETKLRELAPIESDKKWTVDADGVTKIRECADESCNLKPETVHGLIRRIAREYPASTAIATKVNGEWKKWTYTEYYQDIRRAAKSFLKLGLERYHGVGIIGFNSPEWFFSDLGAMFAGGFAVGVYTTNSPEACQYVVDNCEANICVVQNDAQLQKILKVWDQLPHLKAVVQYQGELKEKKDNVYTWAEFMEQGKDVPDQQLDDIMNSQAPNHCCTLIYTSGTTGNPKGVMLSHDNLTWTAQMAAKASKLALGSAVIVSYLPLSHIAAQIFDIYLPLCLAGSTYFAQPDALKGSLVGTLKEVRPTAFLGVPRVWEKINEKLKGLSAQVSGLKKRVAVWAKDIGYRGNINMMNKQEVPWGWTLAKMLLFNKVREGLGLDRCMHTFSAGAPLSKEILEYFMGVNIPIYDIYGMSESTGPHTISLPEAFRIYSAGKNLPGTITKIMDPDDEGNGEVCYNGRHVFMGYLNMEEKTKDAIDEEGWLHSGDIGKVDSDGFLFITGRIKELIITAGGENVPPVLIEDEIKKNAPIISNCMLIGDRRKFLSMIITLKVNVHEETQEPTEELNREALDICKSIGSEATTVEEAEKCEKVKQHIQEGVNKYNAVATSNAQKVQKWIILRKDFSIPGGEIGPTLKLKRPVVNKKYKDAIDGIYGESA
ncbi:long-chain-fatty-acid--CoA ligase ACSBG2-like isoform X2 [Amphiura filiformis]|uniref:long-chain-fatty-acid--CoA ligase ACSBG2-like isoform X2 n=1 Tax=Amphiura filiformis TaxID=82378 RepID=UPI003B212A5A